MKKSWILSMVIIITILIIFCSALPSLTDYKANQDFQKSKFTNIESPNKTFITPSRSTRDIWTDNFETDVLIEEMKNVIIEDNSITLLEKDFSISTTAEFDNGTKSKSNGNYEIETFTDNPGIIQNRIELGSGNGDRFNFDDTDAITWKWNEHIYNPGNINTKTHNIANGVLHISVTNDGDPGAVSRYLNFRLNKNKDVDIHVKMFRRTGQHSSYMILRLEDDLWGGGDKDGAGITWYSGNNRFISSVTKNSVTTALKDVSGHSENPFWFRVAYTASTNTFNVYHGSPGNWITFGSDNSVTVDDDFYVGLTCSATGIVGITVAADFDDFTMNAGTMISGYRTSGTWESQSIKLQSSYNLTNTSIDFIGVAPDTSEIDRIEWIENDIIKASYETDIENPEDSPLTIYNDDLTSGSFNDIQNNFTIKLYLKGDGNHTPTITKISGKLKSLKGHVISKPILLNQNYCWYSLSVSKFVNPNTDIKISVLDGITNEYINGFTNLTNLYFNMSSLDSKLHSTIKLRADLYSSELSSPVLNSWSVTWKEDYPILKPDIPSNYSLPEDSNSKHLIDLGNYFTDYYDSLENLTFKIIYQSNNKHLEAKVKDEHYLSFYTKKQDWTGSESFKVQCMDTGGLQTDSNKFEVIVIPVDDPPVWSKNLPDLKMDEDTKMENWLDLDDYVSDIEGDYLDFTVVNISDPDSIKITINSDNKVTIIPAQDFYGTITVTIQVFESENASLYTNDTFDIIVYPTNDPSIVSEIPDQTTNEDEWLNFTITATDPDPDDKHKFYSNITKNNFWLDTDTGNLSFLPTNDDVGILYVNITVEDIEQMKGFGIFKIIINNTNDPPNDPKIESPKNEDIFKINDQIEFVAQVCSDIDVGDVINYSWDFDLSNGIGKDRVGREVSYTYKSIGRYMVTLTVTDGTIQKSTSIVVNITSSDLPTPGPSGPDDGKSKGKDELGNWLIFGTLIIIIIIILVVIVFLVMRNKKRSLVNKYKEKIEQAYDWARTNPTIGKEKLTNLKLKLSNENKSGNLNTEDFNSLDSKLNEYINLLGKHVAPGQIPTATPLSISPKPIPPQPIQIPVPVPIPMPKPRLQPAEPGMSPTTVPTPTATAKKEVVKCFNCGNLVTVTKTSEDGPTILHCPKCGTEGTI